MDNNKDNTDKLFEFTEAEAVRMICNVYNSKEYHALKHKFTSETYLSFVSKNDSETVYSSFISWIMGNLSFISLPDSPLLNLLRLLANNSVYQSEEDKEVQLMSNALKRAIICNDISISDVCVNTEVSVNKDDSERKGRIDIVICFTWKRPNDDQISHRCRLLIENKVYTNEHDSQCKTYYDFFSDTSKSANDGIEENIFCFLAINKPAKLSDNHYIKVTYQEFLDWVLVPLSLYKTRYSPKYAVYIDDFIDTLTSFKTGGKQQIAMDKEISKLLRVFYEQNSDLIRAAIMQSDDEEVKEAVLKSAKSRKTFNIVFPNNKSVEVTGLVNLVYQIIKYLADRHSSASLINDFQALDVKYASRDLLSDNLNYHNGRQIAASSRRDDIVCTDGKVIYCSNQFAYDKGNADNITPFIDFVKKKYKISITE